MLWMSSGVFRRVTGTTSCVRMKFVRAPTDLWPRYSRFTNEPKRNSFSVGYLETWNRPASWPTLAETITTCLLNWPSSQQGQSSLPAESLRWRHVLPRNLYQKLAAKIGHNFITVSCIKTTLWPLTFHGSCHVPDSFCAGIELCSIACKKLVPEKLVRDWPTHVQVSCTRRLAQVSGKSFWSVCRRH